MSVKANIHIDYSEVSDLRKRNAAHLPRVRNAMARRMAEFIRDEAIIRAPFDAQNMTQGHLRDQISVRQNGMNNYTIEAERVNPNDGFDVALWTHEAVYTPSEKGPLVGRRYLARAVEDNQAGLDGVVANFMDDYLNSL